MSRNPLAALVTRFPGAFGLAWVDDNDFVKTDDRTYDMRPIRQIRGNWYYVEDEA